MEDESKLIKNIETELLRIEEACDITSKSHYNSHDIWSNFHNWFGLSIVILSVGAGITAANDPSISAVLSGIAALITATATFMRADNKASEHKISASDYHALGSKARALRTIQIFSLSLETTMEKLELLSEERARLNRSSPTPLPRAYKAAQKGIAAGQTIFRVDINA